MQTTAGIRLVWHKAVSAWFESYLRIDTRGAVGPTTSEGVHYTPLPYVMIPGIFQAVTLGPGDVFVDVGCGKGRVVCCACRLPVKRVVALELNDSLLQQTLINVSRVRGRRAVVEPVKGSAEQYEFADATVVYLYNPFNGRITESVVDRLFESFSKSPRPMRVAYANPVHETALMKHGWLEKFDEWPADVFPGFGYRVSFWRSR